MIERAILSVLVAAVCGAALATATAPEMPSLPSCALLAQFNRTAAVAVLVHDPQLAQDMAERAEKMGEGCVW
jgi:hypothetical protein